MVRLIPYLFFMAVGFLLGLLAASVRGSGRADSKDLHRKYRDLERQYRELTQRLEELDEKEDRDQLYRKFWSPGNGSNGD
jgi:hypothetical protein